MFSEIWVEDLIFAFSLCFLDDFVIDFIYSYGLLQRQ